MSTDEVLAPRLRANQIGRADTERAVRDLLQKGALANGWLITGPKGAGKATLAYRLARAILDRDALTDRESLAMPATARGFRLVAQNAHPDLFVAERAYDEKNQRYQSEIPVDRIRELGSFLSKTASAGGWRVAIIDTADDLNRQAANALLKSLEEPPAKTAVLLLSSAPGRLLPTIRSRCRRLDLRPLSDTEIETLLAAELGLDAAAARRIAAVARGRPGYALTLAAGEGVEIVESVVQFLDTALARGEPGAAAAAFAGKSGPARWEIFTAVLLERISDAARGLAPGASALAATTPDRLVAAHEDARRLLDRADAVNLDKAQVLGAVARILRACKRAA